MLFNKQIQMMCAALLWVAGSASAQSEFAAKTTQVLAMLKVNTPVDREKLRKVMPQEVRDTVKLHLEGKILHWYGRTDGMGVVFVLDCKSVEEARAVLEKLPLIQEKMASFEYVALSPLMPLRMLLAAPQP